MQEYIHYKDYNSLYTGFNSAAHEEYDPRTKSYFNFCMVPGSSPQIRVFEITQQSNQNPLREIAAIKTKSFSYIHSFSSTPKYVILMAWPYIHDLLGAKIPITGNYIKHLKWYKDKPVFFYVVDRALGKHVATFQLDSPFFWYINKLIYSFHTINAFDDGQDIVIDLCGYDDANIVNHLHIPKEISKEPQVHSSFRRFRLKSIDEAIKNVSKENPKALIDFEIKCSVELPRINEKYRHSGDYTFVYGVANESHEQHQHSFLDSIVKVNVKDKSFKVWSKKGYTPGEPIFVANPNGIDEDDGVLLTVCLDGFGNQSRLVVLDAKSLTELASAQTPVIVPFGFHGSFQ